MTVLTVVLAFLSRERRLRERNAAHDWAGRYELVEESEWLHDDDERNTAIRLDVARKCRARDRNRRKAGKRPARVVTNGEETPW